MHHGGRRLAFVGDLVHGEGRVWSLAATQWAYTGFHENAGREGVAATVLSCMQLLEHGPELLLPSHGDPVTDPPAAVARLLFGLAPRLAGLAWLVLGFAVVFAAATCRKGRSPRAVIRVATASTRRPA